jgi:hypothetical protein
MLCTRLRKTAKNDHQFLPVRLSVCLDAVCPSAWDNSLLIGRVFMKPDIWGFFEITGRRPMYLYDLSRWILLKMQKVSNKTCRENQNTYFVFTKFFPPKSCRLWDNVEKYGTAGAATDNNIIRRMKNAICMPSNWGNDTNTHALYLTL